MRNVLAPFVLVLLTISGCAPSLLEWNTSYVPTGYDFRDYADEGFLFTPEGFLGDYESMGVVNIEFMPEIKKAKVTLPAEIPGYFILQTTSGSYYVQRHDTQKIIDEMHKLAIDMGANAVIRFQILPTTIDNEGTPIPTIRATGFAIKRL